MKLFGNLLLTLSLVLGMICAATAYVGFVDAPDGAFAEDGTYVRLKAPAGAVQPTAAELEALRARYDAGELSAEAYTAARQAAAPVLTADLDEEGTRLTPERLEALRGAEVGTVFTKGFRFGRWRYWWGFLLAALGLLAGSLLVRNAAKAEIAAAAARSDDGSSASPEASLAAIDDLVRGLRRELAEIADDGAALHAVLARLGEIQRIHVPAFVDARPLLVSRMGLGGYAELMDRFAAAERQINRAWSAAADGVLEESVLCLANAEELLQETKAKI